ncbi:MAG TPA: hypothetical protein VLS88_15845 [Polyangiales bacterium]|nr:hypothetical protein [Polyangiales bacterium]
MRHLPFWAFLLLATAWTGCSEDGEQSATTYAERQQALFEATTQSPSRNTYSEIVRLANEMAPDESKIREDLDRMNDRLDTADFKLPGLLRLLYAYSDSSLLSAELLDEIKQSMLAFKYWPDELESEPDPVETDSMVYWTENHFILFASGAYLAGQLYFDEVFTASGETGAQKMETFRPRIMRWLELRYETGFSEWLSNVYYDEDIPALVALVDFAEDQEIVELSKMVLDLIFADMASNHFRGNFGSTHGRTYDHKMSGTRDSTGSTFKLLFDLNELSPGNMSSTMLALSDGYRLPKVIYEMARDFDREEYENRQRMSIEIEEAERWGLDTSLLEDGMTFLTLEAYTHPLTINLFVDMLDAYKWWEHDDFTPFKPFRDILEDDALAAGLATAFEWDITRNMRPEVDIYTYRTPSYMLSTAQDYRKGFGGDQQSNWQATLGMEAVAFTTHPTNYEMEGATPRYWVGYGTMPRAIQVKNVVISIYDVETGPGLYVESQLLFTHAFLSKAKFDEAYKEDGWFFARKGDGYLALWTSDPDADWSPADAPWLNPEHAEFGEYEIIADGEKTIWICELGSASEYGSFDAFKTAIADAPLAADASALTVDYQSPSQGRLVMGWDGPLTQNGTELVVDGFPRYGNPYAAAEFPGSVISFEHAGESLLLDLESRTRQVSSFID